MKTMIAQTVAFVWIGQLRQVMRDEGMEAMLRHLLEQGYVE